MTDGITSEATEGIDAAEESHTEQINAEASESVSADDAMWQAALADLQGESEPDGHDDDEGEQPLAAQPEQPEPEQPEEPAGPARIDPEQEYVFVDESGKEHTVKGSDALYLTNQYHRKLQEKDAELRSAKEFEERYESLYQHDKPGLASMVLKDAPAGERLAAVKNILAETGLTDIAQAVEQRMTQHGLQYDPLRGQQALLEQQRQQLDRQQQQMQVQFKAQQDLADLTQRLGRTLTPREDAGIGQVYQNWMNARQANPNLPMPDIDQAYNMAVEAIRFEDSLSSGKNKQPKQPKTPTERPKNSKPPAVGALSYDDLADAAFASI